MKHIVTKLHDHNEPVLFADSIMGNYTYKLNFANFKAENSPFTGIKQQSEISNLTYIQPNSASQNSINSIENHNFVYISDIKVVVNNLPWTLYFDGSKSKEGVGVVAF